MIIPSPADLAGRYRVANGSRFRLKDISPSDPWGKRLKPIAGEMLKQGCKRMSDLQERLYAQDRWSVLLIFQAMDAAGKDGTIKHVMSGVNPQGCRGPLVQGARRARSSITISYGARRAPCRAAATSASSTARTTKRRWSSACTRTSSPGSSCRASWSPRTSGASASKTSTRFERYLSTAGCRGPQDSSCTCRKEEQRERFLKRLDKPEKHWKFSPADVGERAHFAEYMEAYDDMIRHTATRVGAVARRSRRSQVVHASRSSRRSIIDAIRVARSALPRGRCGNARRVQEDQDGARGGSEAIAPASQPQEMKPRSRRSRRPGPATRGLYALRWRRRRTCPAEANRRRRLLMAGHRPALHPLSR